MSALSAPSVTLIVKAPNQKIADQKIECTLDWTVKQLKQHLSNTYPTNPMVNQQRIIYSGKLLQDDHRLKDILKQYEPGQNVHTIHLACMASMSESPGSVLSQDVNDKGTSSDGLRRRHAAAAAAETPDPSLSHDDTSRAFPNVDFQSYVPHPGMMYYYGNVNMVAPVMPSGASFMPYGAEQLQWMQQAYDQYMMQYLQQFRQTTTAQPHLIGHSPPIAPIVPIQPANQNFPNDLQGAAIEPDQPIQPIGINARGVQEGADDEDGERVNRDWLDNAYALVRFLMLMSVLFFYSSPGRFLATMILAAVVYIYRAGWLRRAPVENRNQREAVGRREAPVAPPEQQQEAQSENSEADTTVVDLHATHRPSSFEVVWSVVTSFFTSLIPENPPPININ